MNFRFNFISVSDLFPLDTDPDPRVCLVNNISNIFYFFFSAIKNLNGSCIDNQISETFCFVGTLVGQGSRRLQRTVSVLSTPAGTAPGSKPGEG